MSVKREKVLEAEVPLGHALSYDGRAMLIVHPTAYAVDIVFDKTSLRLSGNDKLEIGCTGKGRNRKFVIRKLVR